MKSIYILALIASFITYSESIFWELVFVGYKENGDSIYNRWTQQQPALCTLSKGCLPGYINIATLKPQNKHLKSKLVNNWNKPSFRIKEVRVELLNSNSKSVVAWMEFNGRGSNRINWFSKSKLLRSSWDDMYSDGCFNYFSIAGHRKRRFFINQSYGGCPNDLGWLQILDGNTHPCKWDKQPKYPAFLYAAKGHKTRFNYRYSKADIFAIYVKRL